MDKNLKDAASRAAIKELREEGIFNIASTEVILSDDNKTATVRARGTDNRIHPVEVALV